MDSPTTYDSIDNSSTRMAEDCRTIGSFILSDQYAVFFGAGSHLIDVYDAQTGDHLAQYTSEIKTGEHLLSGDKLYLYDRYAAQTQEQTGGVVTYSVSGVGTKVECIDLKEGTQTVIELIQ